MLSYILAIPLCLLFGNALPLSGLHAGKGSRTPGQEEVDWHAAVRHGIACLSCCLLVKLCDAEARNEQSSEGLYSFARRCSPQP